MKFNNGKHWLLIVHGSAALLMTEIKARFYAGEKMTCSELLVGWRQLTESSLLK